MKNELIEIQKHFINGEEINAADGRALHEFLESKQEFANWIKNRIEDYGFIKDQDFLIILSKTAKRRASSYRLSTFY